VLHMGQGAGVREGVELISTSTRPAPAEGISRFEFHEVLPYSSCVWAMTRIGRSIVN
jgi:hypothetical protein